MLRSATDTLTRPTVWLVAGGPLGLAAVRSLSRAAGMSMASWQVGLAVAGGAALSLGGVATLRSPRLAGAAAGVGSAALVASLGPGLPEQPALTLAALVFLTGMTVRLWTRRLRVERIERERLVDLRLSAVIALVTWLMATVAGGGPDPFVATASALASVVAISHALAWTRTVIAGRAARSIWSASIVVATLTAATAGALGRPSVALTVLAAVPAATLVAARATGVRAPGSWSSLILHHPARLVVTTFLLLCALGWLLLALPPAAAEGVDISLLDAGFTAVSAVCVTGLIVLDTPNAFSPLGHVAILLLIQLGALGIMTLSTAALGMLGRRLSVRHERAVAQTVGGGASQLLSAVKRTLAVTFALELCGAVVLAGLFWQAGDDPGQAIWRGVFTAISAFCNAGFALQSDSLVAYQQDPAVLHTVGLLIVAGGLSPAAIVALPAVWQRRRVSLQIKLVLAATAVLVVAGFVGYAALEWNHSLAGLPTADRLQNAWFQSITFRTAGFNSVEMAELRPATMPLASGLMFIGGAPGGTAGGVKVTTACLILLGALAAVRGRSRANAFNRRLPHDAVYKSLAIVAIGGAVTATLFAALLLTQAISPKLALFEIVSASGTVGLSMGATAQLDGVGKVIIMLAMFLGRVGPLTAFLFLTEQGAGEGPRLIEEPVEVG